MIVIIDYDVGNVGSIVNMLKRIDVPAIATSKPEVILQADKLILPGVGAFDNGMRNLRRLGLMDALERKVRGEKTCILGICLGAQLMTQSSEEGQEPGLGWVKARTIRFFSQQAAAAAACRTFALPFTRAGHPRLPRELSLCLSDAAGRC